MIYKNTDSQLIKNKKINYKKYSFIHLGYITNLTNSRLGAFISDYKRNFK
ncbi:hypothetical protein HNQ90_001851 [Algibacter amylolyticus]|nr:hypothetical protein [Algibacter amylolyticus]